MLRRSSSHAARVAGLLAGVVMVAPTAARAQSGTEVSLADTLYRQARELSAAGRFADACPKFAESYRLDPGTGTLLNLASCHESLGKLATAWVEYNDGLVQSRRDHRQSRIDFAEEHIASLSPKLSRLTVTLASDADKAGLELSIDGIAVGAAALGAPTPLDPGAHTIDAKAPGKKPWSGSVAVGAIADQQTLVIPALEPLPPPAAVRPVVVAPPPAITPVEPAPPQADVARERPVPTAVYIAGGATIALAVGASITGGVYLDQRGSYDTTGRYSANQKSDHDSLVTLGVVNLALWIATAGGAAATTYFYVTRPERPAAPSAGLTVTPWASVNGAGLVAGGTL